MDIERELSRRHANARAAMAEHDLDALVVSGSEYSGFEGAVTYLSGFQIVHRYAYVVIPADGESYVVFPQEAKYVGEHGTTPLEQIFHPRPGELIAARAKDGGWSRVGVFGLDYIMAVRDYTALAKGSAEIVGWDVGFDHARAVKSDEELESVREACRINEEGVWAVLDAFAVGKTEAELMAIAEEVFTRRGAYRTTMDMIIEGPDGSAYPEFRFPSERKLIERDTLIMYGLEITGPGGHWVEFSRPFCAGTPSKETLSALDAYHEYFDAAKATMKAGNTSHDVHMAVSKGFHERGFFLGHVTGHSIGMTMIEFPKIGEGVESVLAENMVFSMHPHAIAANGEDCLYMQDTWLVTTDGGVPLATLPMEIVRR